MKMPEITLDQAQDLGTWASQVGEFRAVKYDFNHEEHRWYILSDLIFEWRGRYFKTYYYSTLKSDMMGLSDIESFSTVLPVTEVYPVEKIIIDYATKEEL